MCCYYINYIKFDVLIWRCNGLSLISLTGDRQLAVPPPSSLGSTKPRTDGISNGLPPSPNTGRAQNGNSGSHNGTFNQNGIVSHNGNNNNVPNNGHANEKYTNSDCDHNNSWRVPAWTSLAEVEGRRAGKGEILVGDFLSQDQSWTHCCCVSASSHRGGWRWGEEGKDVNVG